MTQSHRGSTGRVGTRLTHAALVLAALGGCGDDILRPPSDEAAFYVVISAEPLEPSASGSPVDSSLYGLVGTLGSGRSLRYRGVSQIAATRRADGIEYDWGVVPRSGDLVTGSQAVSLVEHGNLRLPWEGTGGRLGRDSLVGGEIIDISLTTEGVLVTASVTVPTTPTIVIEQDGSTTRMRWTRPPGVTTFSVSAQTDRTGLGSVLTTDTTYVIQRDAAPFPVPTPAYFTVVALDANLADYLRNPSLTRSGVVGAHGIAGATAQTRVVIPPP